MLFSRLFRHRHTPPTGWCGGVPYAALKYIGTDAMGFEHRAVELKCVTCGKPFAVANIHLPKGSA